MRTFSTSAGLPATPPRNPDVEAMPISKGKDGEVVPVEKRSFSFS